MGTDLATIASQIGFKNGSNLVRYSNNPDVQRKVLSEGLYQALSLYSDVKVETVSLMMSSILEDYKNEPTHIIVDTIKDLVAGKRKIFGRVSPDIIRELMDEKIQLLSEERERQHDRIAKTTGHVEGLTLNEMREEYIRLKRRPLKEDNITKMQKLIDGANDLIKKHSK